MILSNNPESAVILEQLAEQVDQIFFIYDLIPQKIRYLNPVFDEIFGQSRFHFLEDSPALFNMVHPEDKAYVQESWQNIISRTQAGGEFRIINAAGNIKWLCLKTYLIFNPDDSESLVGFAEDVTIKKDHQFTLLKFSERKDAILHSISHDLAGPINIIRGLMDVISDETKTYENARIQECVTYVQQTCQKSISLIKELLNNEFLESANVKLNKWRFDLVEKIQNVVTVYRQAEINSVKEITFTASHDVLFITADEVKFMQVINNLISNANKFTPSGGHINIALKEMDETILLTVTDDGIGIPENLHSQLFDKFTNARRPGLLGEEPVGLGMSIIKNVVDLHQGKIWFTSEENNGATFYIEIPKE